MISRAALPRHWIAVWISVSLGAFAVIGGAITLVGWSLEIPRLTDWYRNGISMQANTALAAVCIGSALVLQPHRRPRLVLAFGALAGLIGFATLLEHMFDLDLGIDTLLFNRTWGTGATVAPGRMGPSASVSFTLLGLGTVLSVGRTGGWGRRIAPWLGMAVTSLSMIAIVGYFFGADQLYTIPRISGIAFQTAVIVWGMGIGLAAAIGEQEPARTMLSPGGGGLLARRALPFIIVLPLVFGWVGLWGQEAGLYDTRMGVSLLIVGMIILMCAVVSWGVAVIGVRERALIAVQEAGVRAGMVLNAARDQFIVLDQNWRYAYVNHRVVEVSGIPQHVMIGRTLWDIWPAIVGSPLDTAARRVMSERQAESLEYNDPSTGRWFNVRIFPSIDEGIALFILEISDRKQLEQELRQRFNELSEAEARMRSVVDHVLDGIITIDARGVIKSFNKSAEKLFGYSVAEVIGHNVKMLMPEPYVSEHDTYISNYLRTGVAKIIGTGREVTGRRKDGSTFPMELAVSTFVLDDQQYFTGIVRDVTERKELARELRQRLDELREADLRKDEFLATLAHELRNPLAPLRNSLEIMKLVDRDPLMVQKARETMDRQVSQMERLIDDLMDVSRITRNKLELRRERVELAPIVEHALEACRPLASKANHEVAVDLPKEPIYLFADAVRLAQVFGNLLTNACKYTEPGGRIQLTATRQGDLAVVSIRDTGIGIPPQMLPHVFDLFTQIDKTLERSQGGLGIGLTLVRRLVELHNGTITAQSEGEGRGSEFVLRLPALADVPQPDPLETNSGKFKPTKSKRVLVVDDNRDAALSLTMLLTLTGHETATAHDGAEAMAIAETFRPDLMLLDIGLPKLNGYDVCRAIRAQPWGRDIVVVALTGWGQDEDRRKSTEAGFNDHLVKPVDQEALLTLLAEEKKESRAEPLSR